MFLIFLTPLSSVWCGYNHGPTRSWTFVNSKYPFEAWEIPPLSSKYLYSHLIMLHLPCSTFRCICIDNIWLTVFMYLSLTKGTISISIMIIVLADVANWKYDLWAYNSYIGTRRRAKLRTCENIRWYKFDNYWFCSLSLMEITWHNS